MYHSPCNAGRFHSSPTPLFNAPPFIPHSPIVDYLLKRPLRGTDEYLSQISEGCSRSSKQKNPSTLIRCSISFCPNSTQPSHVFSIPAHADNLPASPRQYCTPQECKAHRTAQSAVRCSSSSHSNLLDPVKVTKCKYHIAIRQNDHLPP